MARMTPAEWKKKKEEEKKLGTGVSSTSSATSSDTTSNGGSAGRMTPSEWKAKKASTSFDWWAKSSISLINDIRDNSGSWYDDDEYQSRNNRITSLLSNADNWRKQYSGNRKAVSYIDSVVDALSQAKNISFDYRKYYSKWDSREEYDTAVRQDGYFKKYDGMTSQDIETTLGGMDDGEEKEWLTAYKGQVEYDEMLNYDLDLGRREVKELEGVLEEYDRLILQQSTQNPQSPANVRLQRIVATYGSKSQIEDLLARKKSYLTQAQRAQEGVKLSGVADEESELYDPEFKAQSGYVSTKSDGLWGKLTSQYGLGYEDLTYEYINGANNGMREEILDKNRAFNADNVSSSEDKWKLYDYLTEDEIAIYNYYYAKDGKEAADRYLGLLTDSLTNRKASERFEGSLEGNTGLELLFSLEAGLDQFESGLKNFFNFSDDYIPYSEAQVLSGMVREDLKDNGFMLPEFMGGASLGQAVYDMGTTTANMLPSILVSFVPGAGQVLGAASMGVSAAGNAYQEMLNLGYSKGQSRLYSALVGGSEAGLQYLLGGIGKLGGVADDAVTKTLLSHVDNAFGRVAIQLGANMVSEGFEEGLQEVLTPWFQSIAFGLDENVNWSDVMYSSLLGALTANIFEGGGVISENVGHYKTGKKLQAAGVNSEALSKIGSTFSPDTVAYQLAGKVNEKTGAYTIGRMFHEIGASMTEQNVQDITQNLIGKGMRESDAGKLAQAISAIMDDPSSVTSKQMKLLDANDVLASAVIEELVDPNTTYYQRQYGYEQALMKLADDVAAKKTSATTQVSEAVMTEAKQAMSGEQKTDVEVDAQASSEMEQALKFSPFDRAGMQFKSAVKTMYDPASGVAPAEFAKASRAVYEQGLAGETMQAPQGLDQHQAELAYAMGRIAAGQDVQAVSQTAQAQQENVSTGDTVMDAAMQVAQEQQEAQKATAEQKKQVVAEAYTDLGSLTSEPVIVNMDQASRDALSNGYDPASGVSPQVYVSGSNLAFLYGYEGISMNENTLDKDSLVKAITKEQAGRAYALGVAAAKTAVAKADAAVKAKPGAKIGKNGRVHFDGDRNALSKRQRVSLEAMDKIAEALGVQIYVFESDVDSQGRHTGVNGWYEQTDGSIHIDLYAGTKGQETMLFTVAHELTHFIKQWSPAKFKDLADFLMKEYGQKGVSVEDLVLRQIAKAKNSKTNPRTLTFEQAYEEVIADSMETMLSDGNVVEKLAKLKQQDKSLWQKIKDFISDLVAKIRKVYEGLSPDSEEGRYVAEMKDALEQLQELFAEAAVEASENYQAAMESVVETDADAVSTDEIITDGAVVTDGQGTMYSIKSMKHDIADGQMFEDLKTYCNWTQVQVDELRRQLTDLVEYMTPHRNILDMNEEYGREGRRFSPYKPNSDPLYKISMDFSTMCSKRLLTQYVIEQLQLREKRPMTAEEQMAIRDMLNEYRKVEKGLQVACAMCYVEAARLKSPKQIQRWLKDPAPLLRDYFGKQNREFNDAVKEAQADFKESRGYARNAPKKDMKPADVRELNKIGPRMRSQYIPSAEELAIIERAKSLPNETYLTAANLADLSETDPVIYTAYTAFVRTATRSKSLETDEPYYYGDSTRDNGNGIIVSDSFIEAMNRENGMRFSSWSDWRIQHLLDFITAVIDNSVRGAAMHGYTKFPDEVRVLGKTGMMFNMSGVAGSQTGLNPDGSLSFSATESIDKDEAVKLRDEFPEHAGLQCIGVSDAHIIALLKSDIIDYVIPYHISGLNAALRRMADIFGWDDYTDTQHAVIDKSIKYEDAVDQEHWHEEPVFSEFFVGYDTGMTGIKAMRASAERYVQMCRNRGLVPKFEQFVNEDNYWKLLIDRKMINQKTGSLIKQKPVSPNFDFGTIKGIVDKYVANYDSGLEARAFNHIVENWDSIPKRIRDLKKKGGTKPKKVKKAVGALANQTTATLPADAMLSDRDLTEDPLYPDTRRERSAFNRSFMNKISGLKPGEERDIIITTASNVYVVRACGTSGANPYVGEILGRESLDDEYLTEVREEFNYGANEDGERIDSPAEEIRYNRRRGRRSYRSVKERLEAEGYGHLLEDESDGYGERDRGQSGRDPKGNGIKLSDRDTAPTFYSHMARVVDGVKQDKLGAASVVSMLRGKGVKAEEIKWSGIETFLDGKKSVTKAELQEFIAGSMLQIEEDVLTNQEIPYSQEHLDQIAKYEAERDTIVENLKSEWKRIVGTDIPIVYFGAGLESAVVHNLMEANATKRGQTEAGYKYREARTALQRAIEDGDHYFGYDNARQAIREAVRDPYDFMKSYEMTSFEERVFRDFIKAKESYRMVEGISAQDQEALKAIAESADRFSSRILKVKSEHRAKAAKYLTKYGSYTIKGGTNYRELLFRMPGSTYSNNPMDIHWDRTGVLAHARIQDLNTFLGKMLFIEEIQSDWHNEGHKAGYEYVPDAPFRDNYHEYVLKRLIRMAAEEGYDSIGWTTAEIQMDRWSDEFAEGYRIEYDQDIPKFLRKYGKKWGTTVGKTVLDNGTEVWSMAITDSMQESVMTEGQPLYSDRDYVAYDRTAILTEDTVDRWLGDYASEASPNYTQMYIAYMSPDKFLDLTTSIKGRQNIEWESRELREAEFAEYTKDQPIFLEIDHETGEVTGHEGRHRCVALQRAGIDKVPVLFMDFSNKHDKKPIDSLTLTGQQFRDSASHASVTVRDIIPLSYANRQEIIKRFATQSSMQKIGEKYGWKKTLRYSDRSDGSVSNRTLLVDAFEGLAQTPDEKQLLAEYRGNISKVEEVQERLRKVRARISELMKQKGQSQKVQELFKTASELSGLIDSYDRKLLELEASKPLRDVLARAKTAAYQEARQRSEENMAKYRQQVAERFDRGVEGRRKTAMRQKIRKIIRELDKILNRGDKKRNVKEDMKDFVAEALASAEVLFTDNYTNEDMVRNGVGVELTEAEAKYMEEARAILEEMSNLPSGGYDAFLARQEAEEKLKSRLAYRMSKLKDVFFRERQRVNKTSVSEVLGKLADSYAKLETSEYAYVNGAYHEAVYQYLRMLQEDVGGTIVKDMTLGQLEELHKAYTMVLTTVRNANTMFAEDLKQSRDQLANRVMFEVHEAGGEHGRWTKGQIARNRYSWNNTKPVYAAERIGSSTFSKLFNGLFKGQYQWGLDMDEAKDFRQRIANKYGFKDWDMEKLYTFESSSGDQFQLSLNQIMSLYAYSKRDQAHDHLLKGGFVFGRNTEEVVTEHGIKRHYLNRSATAFNVSDEILGSIISKLTGDQRAFVDEMQDYLSTTMGAKGNEVSMRLYGVKLFLEQFYFPLRSAGQYMEKAKEADMKKQQGQISIANSSFSHATKPKASNPIILDGFTDVWASHVNEMSMYHSMVLPMEDFRRVYNYSSPALEGQSPVGVNSVIENAYGPEATAYFDQLYKELNGGAITDPRETAFKERIGKFKKAAVMLSSSVVVQQFSAIGRAYALIDPKYFIGARVDKKRHKALWAELKKYAPVAIIKEMGGFDTGMGAGATDYLLKESYGRGERIKGFFKDEQYRGDILGWAPAMADELTWCSIWEAVKRETKAKNPGLDGTSEPFLMLAGARFCEVIEKTQVYDSVLARSANMRSKNGLMQMATAFLAEPTTTVNMIEDAIRKGNKKYIARTFGSVAVSILINNALASLVYAMRDDDEDETFLEKYSQALTSGLLDDINPMTYYPVLKDVWSLLQGYDVERSDMSVVADVVDAVKKAITAFSKYDADMDEDELAEHYKRVGDSLWSLLDAGCSALGIPEKNLRREIMALINTGKTVSEDLFGERDTTWNSFWDAVGSSALDATPVVGLIAGESKQDKLYDAIVSGDTAYVNRLKGGYKDESSYNTAVRKALRENDPRVREAAAADINGDPSERVRIAKEIIAEGHFSQDNVVAAINAEINALNKGGTETASKPKASGLYNAEDFAMEIANGDQAAANAAKVDIIQTAVKNGKTQEKAEKSFVSAARDELKDLFLAGDISEQEAISALMDYCGQTEDGAIADVQYWAFKQDYPDVYADDSWFDKYYAEVADSGIEIDMYMSYRNQVKDITGENKKEGRMAVIHSLPITSAQKDALYYAEGWAASKLYEAPWH